MLPRRQLPLPFRRDVAITAISATGFQPDSPSLRRSPSAISLSMSRHAAAFTLRLADAFGVKMPLIISRRCHTFTLFTFSPPILSRLRFSPELPLR